ncbi:DUF58 domain-containing protein [bacterium]|nr:DUF58 domain-containing protein [bacterium]
MTFTSRTIILIFLSAVCMMYGVIDPAAVYVSIGILLLTAGGCAFEFFQIPDERQILVSRHVASKLALGAPNTVTLDIENRSLQSLSLVIRDEPPDEFELRDVIFKERLKRRERKELTYRVTPDQRGDYFFHQLNIACDGPIFGLIRRILVYQIGQSVKVYPNYKEIKKFELMSMRGKLAEIGMRPVKQYGLGTEFESLREYNPDDEYRRIDWNASARAGKLISMQYQLERSQQVMILIDAGRLMGTTSLGLSKLDHAINAALMLAHISVKRDDRVGLLVFSQAIQSYLAPKKNKSQLARMADQLYNVKSELVESDYGRAFEFLKLKQKRRSLIVVFTEVLDRYASQILIKNLAMMYPKHLPLCVIMKDRLLSQIIHQPADTTDSVFEKAVTAELINERREALAFLKTNGVMVLDVLPEELTTAVINQYIEIKSKAVL